MRIRSSYLSLSSVQLPDSSLQPGTTDPGAPTVTLLDDFGAYASHDEGDFYWHMSEQIPLLRLDNEILVKLLPDADKEAILGALSNEQLTREL
jgi:hypothetical protein